MKSVTRNGRTVIASTGVAVPLTNEAIIGETIIQALPTNVGNIAVGMLDGFIERVEADGVLAKISTADDHGLADGQSVTIIGVRGTVSVNGLRTVSLVPDKPRQFTVPVDLTGSSPFIYGGGYYTAISIVAGSERGDQLTAFGTTRMKTSPNAVFITGTAGDGVLWRTE
jgi:hypothetical protein